MDEIDFSISFMLMQNSRISYQKLADIFKMSVKSIHNRIKSLVDVGIVQNFHAQLGVLNFPEMANVIMYGISRTKDKKGLIQRLGENECIYNVTQASGNLFYILSYIRNINDLDPLVSYVNQIGEMNDLTVGIESQFINVTAEELEELGDLSLSKLDYLIIDSLNENSRKPVSEIAVEVGASPKTVSRHLNRMIEKNLISFTIDWVPDKTGVIMSMIIIKIKSSTNLEKSRIIDDLRKKFSQKLLFIWSFSNLPNLLIACVWTPSMKELQEIETKLISDYFESVNVTVLIEGKNFSTWVEKTLEERLKEMK